MAIIRYERGSDGVVRESVSNDGGKTYTQTGATSSNGYSGGYSSSSGSSSSKKNTGSSSGTNYSGYTESQYNNQKNYLESLIKQGGGNATWAKNELNNLNTQYSGNKNTGVTSGTTGSGSSGSSGASGTTQQWDTSGWNNYTGATGKQFSISPINGTIIVTTNGVQRRVLPTDTDYNTTYAAMQKDIGNAYTPTNSYDRTNSDGTTTTYTTKNYTQGNGDLQYALEQAAKTNPGLSTEDYVKSLYNRIGTTRSDGSTVTLADVNNELNRLGLSDYNSDNVIYTVGGNLIPNNQFTTFKDGSYGSNSDDSRWVSYGGQDYLIGGDSANQAQYASGKAGNTTLLDMLFGNMAENPYAMQDPEFLTSYNQALNNFNNSAGIAGNNSITGNQKVDDVINYWNSVNNYNSATGSTGTSSLLDYLQSYLDSGLEANQDFLAQQRSLAEQQAQQQASDAYINQILQGDAMKQQLSAMGLGTSGALQSALLGVQGNYNSNLNEINNNLNTMLSGLSEQELQLLTDYYNNMANYAYQVSNDEADRAIQQAQLALQQQQLQYDLQQQQWENAYKQQLYDDSLKQYQDTLTQQEFENNLALEELSLKQQQSKSGNSSSSGSTTDLSTLKYLYENGLIDDATFLDSVGYSGLTSNNGTVVNNETQGNVYTGNSGKQYVVDNNKGIYVYRTDGSESYVQPGDANYYATVQAMNSDGVNSGLTVRDWSVLNNIPSQQQVGLDVVNQYLNTSNASLSAQELASLLAQRSLDNYNKFIG